MVATEVEGRARMEPRELDECVQIHRSSPEGARQLTDDEVVMLVQKKVKSLFSIVHISVCSDVLMQECITQVIRGHSLEAALGDDSRAVVVRRKYIERQSKRYLK